MHCILAELTAASERHDDSFKNNSGFLFGLPSENCEHVITACFVCSVPAIYLQATTRLRRYEDYNSFYVASCSDSHSVCKSRGMSKRCWDIFLNIPI